MTGFEPQISGVGSDCFTTCATAQSLLTCSNTPLKDILQKVLLLLGRKFTI